MKSSSLPWRCVVWCSFNWLRDQHRRIAVVNRVVRVFRHTDQIVRIRQKLCAMPNVGGSNRIHVMNENRFMNLVPLHREVASEIPRNYLISYSSPFKRVIELLIQISLESKSLFTDQSVQLKVFETIPERAELRQLSIRPDTHRPFRHFHFHYTAAWPSALQNIAPPSWPEIRLPAA